MKAVLTSIQPKWCELIASGKKTVEVRKTRPKIETPFKCYIYMSKGQRELLYVWKKGDLIWDDIYYEQDKPQFVKGGYKYEHTPYFQKVIGEFVCDEITADNIRLKYGTHTYHNLLKNSCLSERELYLYGNWEVLYGWHISDLVIYDKPKELSEFRKPCSRDLECYHCAMYSEYKKVCHNAALKITRPPQSWMYVEG